MPVRGKSRARRLDVSFRSLRDCLGTPRGRPSLQFADGASLRAHRLII